MTVPSRIPRPALDGLLLAMADDELILGHRDSEWTGHAPILEEDIAFSNIAQDEIGHSLVWFALYEKLTGRPPDAMGFERDWKDFRCCHFVAYPKGDFAYTVVRQFLFDTTEQVRLRALTQSQYQPLKDASEKILREEGYHLLHSQGLVERLGDATDESRRRMQSALDAAFPQSLGIFEQLSDEDELVRAGVIPASQKLLDQWLDFTVPLLRKASLSVPIERRDGGSVPLCKSDDGGRKGNHLDHLKQLVHDMQMVYQIAPNSKW